MAKATSEPSAEDARYALFDQLDQLEELLEDMIALDVESRVQIEQRIEELNAKIDALDELEDEMP